jgi:hypothetical protein
VFVATQEQLAGCPTDAVFWHFPAFPAAVVQAVPLPQTDPPTLVTQGPAETIPTLCNRPGKPVSLAQDPAYVTAVDTVSIAPPATMSIADVDKARISLFFQNIVARTFTEYKLTQTWRQGFFAPLRKLFAACESGPGWAVPFHPI